MDHDPEQCPCRGPRGVPGEGYTWIWDDDLEIRHEDWIDCRCRSVALGALPARITAARG